MKKIINGVFVTIILLLSFSTTVFASGSLKVYFDDVDCSDSSYTVKVENMNKRMKAIIEFDDLKYSYDIFEGNNHLPLQFGAGNYKITVYENIKDTRYKKIKHKNIKVKDNTNPFISSSQIINFDYAYKVLERKKDFLNDKMTDEEKVMATYYFVIDLLSYDYGKIEKVKLGTYIPKADEILVSKKGICYDYSVIFAIILRSEGIPTKLNMGYHKSSNIYHAWNEVLVDGEWKTIDPTTETIIVYRNSEEYKVEKFY